jgi:uncharacterized protein YkwD
MPALSTLLIVGTLLPTSLGATSAKQGCAGADVQPTRAELRRVVNAALCLVNQRRADHGSRPLHVDKRLSTAARRHAHDMVRRHYFSHVSLSGTTLEGRLRLAGYLRRSVRSWTVSEDIGWGRGDLSSPRRMVRTWMHSPPHRLALLDPRMREIGMGVAPGAPSGAHRDAGTYVMDLGLRRRR